MIKVFPGKEADSLQLTTADFEEQMGVKWLFNLEFPTPNILEKVKKRSALAIRKKQLNVREKWLGVRFHSQISSNYVPKVSIRYIDETWGYGVFAEEAIPVGAFIGEYTGIVRKRTPRIDRKNDYCFEYTIGDWIRNPYIIDASEKGNFCRYINHSEAPNLESLSVYVNEVMHIILISLKDIEKGAQLCYHYGDYFWKKRSTPLVTLATN